MGSVGDCYDNAMCDGFFATLECLTAGEASFPHARSHCVCSTASFSTTRQQCPVASPGAASTFLLAVLLYLAGEKINDRAGFQNEPVLKWVPYVAAATFFLAVLAVFTITVLDGFARTRDRRRSARARKLR
jgi:hypothetical protein